MKEKKQYLYLQIFEDLKSKIENGELAPGACLPHSDELAGKYGVSTITIVKALNILKDKGYIVRVKGKGTFISQVIEESVSLKKESSEVPDLCTERTKLIGVVLEHISSCFGLDLLYMMDKCASLAGYKILFRFSYGDRALETQEIQYLKAAGVMGLIVMPCHGMYYNVELLKIIIEGMPMVLLDKKMDGIPVSSVRTDNGSAMLSLVSYLAAKGKKNIGFIRLDEMKTSSVIEREKGFFNAIKKEKFRKMPVCCLASGERITEIFSEQIKEGWESSIAKYLDENQELDGLVCAEYGITRCLGRFRTVLEERNIAVGSVDEDYLSSHGGYFAHVKQDEKTLGEKAVSLLIQQMEGDTNYRQGDYLVKGIFREEQ